MFVKDISIVPKYNENYIMKIWLLVFLPIRNCIFMTLVSECVFDGIVTQAIYVFRMPAQHYGWRKLQIFFQLLISRSHAQNMTNTQCLGNAIKLISINIFITVYNIFAFLIPCLSYTGKQDKAYLCERLFLYFSTRQFS